MARRVQRPEDRPAWFAKARKERFAWALSVDPQAVARHDRHVNMLLKGARQPAFEEVG